VLAVVVVLFGGREKISNIMRDFAQGIDAFKQAPKDNKDEPSPRPPRRGLSPGLLLMAVVALVITILAAVKNMK
jgi:sec-independent protein translocase protein TatA